MNKGYLYLHNHPKMEEMLGVDEKHVIVDRDAWEDARNKGLKLPIAVVSKSFTAKQIVDLLEDEETLDDAILFFKEKE